MKATPLDPEQRPHTNLLAEVSFQRLRKSNDSGGLALSERSGVDASHYHVVAVLLRSESIAHTK
jgi:hypothetical protein